MKYQVIFILLLSILCWGSVAQDIPLCMEKLDKKTNLTTTRFERVIELKRNRKVYQFSVKSLAHCMDCENGTIFYDASCNVVAYFFIGRGASAFVENGYTASEFGKADYPNIRYGSGKSTMPDCILKGISNVDSLRRAGVMRISQVRIKDKILYGFEHRVDPKLANCKDCSRSIVYYDDSCKPEVTFKVGGIAGVKGEKGYTSSDFFKKNTLKVLWQTN